MELTEAIRNALKKMEEENKTETKIKGLMFGYEMEVTLKKVEGNKFTLIVEK